MVGLIRPRGFFSGGMAVVVSHFARRRPSEVIVILSGTRTEVLFVRSFCGAGEFLGGGESRHGGGVYCYPPIRIEGNAQSAPKSD